jgi:hypothetical protein
MGALINTTNTNNITFCHNRFIYKSKRLIFKRTNIQIKIG